MIDGGLSIQLQEKFGIRQAVFARNQPDVQIPDADYQKEKNKMNYSLLSPPCSLDPEMTALPQLQADGYCVIEQVFDQTDMDWLPKSMWTSSE